MLPAKGARERRLNADPQLINFHTDIFMMDMPIANVAVIDFHKQSINGSKKKLGSSGSARRHPERRRKALSGSIKGKTNKR